MVRLVFAVAMATLTLGRDVAVAQGARGGAASVTPYVQHVAYTIKPGMLAEFREFVIRDWNPIAKKGGLTQRASWLQDGGEGNVVHMSTPLDSLAALDQPSLVQKAVGTEGARVFQTRVARFITRIESSVIRFRDDLSYLPPRSSPPRMAELFVFEVDAGKLPVFEARSMSGQRPTTGRTCRPTKAATMVLPGALPRASQSGIGGSTPIGPYK